MLSAQLQCLRVVSTRKYRRKYVERPLTWASSKGSQWVKLRGSLIEKKWLNLSALCLHNDRRVYHVHHICVPVVIQAAIVQTLM